MAEEEAFDAGTFVADYPIWILCDKGTQPGNAIAGMQKTMWPGKGMSLPVFTDHDLAQRWIEAMHRSATVEPVALIAPDGAIKVAEYFQNAGVNYVVIDPCFRPLPGGSQLEAQHGMSMDEFLKMVRDGAGPANP
jgi:hypothetical protein